MALLHRIYFVPGMFGFGRLAGYDYFHHMRAGLERRFAAQGLRVSIEDIPTPPTSSVRHRARVLARTIQNTCGSDAGPIHLVGHSTGGLDARLVLSPTASLNLGHEALAWRERARTVATIDTPHYGTPLASHFTTVSGTRVLYALSLLTVVSLSVGEPSLALFSRLLAGLGGVGSLFGDNLKLISTVTDSVLRFVDREGRTEIIDFLSKIKVDQGAIVQIMPEAMDLFNATTANRAGVAYGSIAALAPRPRPTRFGRRLLSPYAALTAAIYSTMYQFASQKPSSYGYAKPDEQQAGVLEAAFGHKVTESDNDGIIPTISMIWGKLLWAGEGDHLDVLGHFHDDVRPGQHVDWMTSGANFTRARFSSLLDSLSAFQVEHS
jgi:triacylglycerol lipase